MDLFDQNLKNKLRAEAPLADRLRPQNFEEFVGQKEVVGEGKLLRSAIERDEIPSMIFWGPPGTGKSTLARIIAEMTKSTFVQFSAVNSGVKEFREIIKLAIDRRKFNNQRTILFIDEIHRWNKAQQDALLPYVEKGIVTLIGATTENPSFEIISALLSRSRVFVLEPLELNNLETLIDRALRDKERGLGTYGKKVPSSARKILIGLSGGDARIMLNALEIAVTTYKEKEITPHIDRKS